MRLLFSLFRTVLFAFLSFFVLTAGAQVSPSVGLPATLGTNASDGQDAVVAEITADRSAATPGGFYEVGILLKHKPGWHTYWKNPGDVGEATQIEWKLPRNWKIKPLGWPLPKVYKTGELTSYVYDGDVLLPFQLEVPWGTPYGTRATIRAKVSWVACRNICIPQETTLRFSVPIDVASKPSQTSQLFRQAHTDIPEKVRSTSVTAVQDGKRLYIEFPPSAGLISESAVFIPTTQNLLDLSVSKTTQTKGRITSLLLTLKADNPNLLSSLEGILVADGGPLKRGWAIETSIPVKAGKIVQGNKELLKKPRESSPFAPAKTDSVPLMSPASALWCAFLGGLILNLMPCVFPVLSLKILHLADQTRRNGSLLLNGLSFAGGVLASTLFLAVLLLSLRSIGYAVGWGFQLQTPWVVAVLALLFFAITLNLLGVFEFTAASHLADSRALRSLPTSGPISSFCSGVLTVIVASPCTAPFMGAALGYAVTQSALQACSVFFALGLGIACPWLLLTLFPGWIRKLPKPGMWMVYLRRFMALPMMLAVLWLIWVLSHQVDGYGLITLFLASCALTLSLWAFGREQYGRGHPRVLKIASLFVTLGCILLLVFNDFSPKKHEENSIWQPFSVSAVERALHEGKPVIVDFTASWCLTCQLNKITALHTQETDAVLKQYGFRRFVADWTKRDAQITRVLNAFGRTGVPLCVIYDVTGKPILLPELLRQETLLDALKKAAIPPQTTSAKPTGTDPT